MPDPGSSATFPHVSLATGFDRRTYWLCQLAGWSGLFAFMFVSMATGPNPTRPIIYASVSVLFVSAFLATHFLRGVLRRVSHRLTGAPLIFRVTAGVLLLALIMSAALHAALPLWLSEARNRPPFASLMMQYTTMLGGWTAVYLAIGFYRKHREATLTQLRLESARRDAELRALKTQINPHFLFNSLNTLRALIPRELEKPRTAVTLLADLLRASLSMDQHDVIPLARELESVDNYLALEQLRLESRLRVTRRISPDALACPVPPFLLQSVVENAIKHGVAQREDGGEIAIDASVHDGALHLRVTNPGRLLPASGSPGIGLQAARARLHQLCGSAAQLTLQQTAPDCVTAALTLPLRLETVSHA